MLRYNIICAPEGKFGLNFISLRYNQHFHLFDSIFQLQSNYSSREQKIKQCIDVLASEVRSLKQEKDSRPDNIQLLKHLRREQTSLRLLQTELGVEEVIKERTMKVFHEHCRNYYKLPDASSQLKKTLNNIISSQSNNKFCFIKQCEHYSIITSFVMLCRFSVMSVCTI